MWFPGCSTMGRCSLGIWVVWTDVPLEQGPSQSVARSFFYDIFLLKMDFPSLDVGFLHLA